MPILLTFCLLLWHTYSAQNSAGRIGRTLDIAKEVVRARAISISNIKFCCKATLFINKGHSTVSRSFLSATAGLL